MMPQIIDSTSVRSGNTIRRPPLGDPRGVQMVATAGGGPPTYVAANQLTLVAMTSTHDLFCMAAPTLLDARILRASFSGIASTANTSDLILVARSTLDSGGTSGTTTPGRFDPSDPASTVVLTAWTANDCVQGAAFATIGIQKLSYALAASPSYLLTWDFRFGKPVRLRAGTNDCFCFNIGTATIAGGVLNYEIVWVEE